MSLHVNSRVGWIKNLEHQDPGFGAPPQKEKRRQKERKSTTGRDEKEPLCSPLGYIESYRCFDKIFMHPNNLICSLLIV